MSWVFEAGIQNSVDCTQKYLDTYVNDGICTAYSYNICCPDDYVADVDCAGNTLFEEAMLCQNSYISVELLGGAECTTFSCLPASTSSERDDEGGFGIADDGVSGTTTDDSASSFCATETTECLSDEECTACWRASVDAALCETEAWTECFNDYVPGFTGGCESIVPSICCPDEFNGNDCSGNAQWISYQVCTISETNARLGEECERTFTACEIGSEGTDDFDDYGVENDDEPGEVDPEGNSSGAAGAGSMLSIAVSALVLGGTFLAAP